MMLLHSMAIVAMTLAHFSHFVSGSPLLVSVGIRPVPGMPSLESLGLTAVGLFEEAVRRVTHSSLESAIEAANLESLNAPSVPKIQAGGLKCYENLALFHRVRAAACAAYLESLNNTPCEVRNQCTLMVQSFVARESAIVSGFAISAKSTSSYCRHVGRTVREILDACNLDGSRASFGTNAAYGNGNFRVEVVGAENRGAPCITRGLPNG
jgi:hypothetical protein